MSGILKERLKQYLLRRHPAWLAAYDYYFKPDLRNSWGGAFNGQTGRTQIFEELISKIQFQAIIETGTYRGTTTEFFAQSRLPVYTVEAYPRFYHFSRLRFRKLKNVSLELRDSRQFLARLAADRAVPKENAFFYLDSHWQEDLPLKEEVGLITGSWRGVAIMIDDFKVPGDAGYSYDDYGAGKALCLDYLQPLSAFGVEAFFPALPSEQETGRKRGCVVLGDKVLAERMKSVQSLTSQTSVHPNSSS